MLFDIHNHCQYSCDSRMKLEEALATARSLGLGIAVTEHWDYDYPTNPTAFIFDLKDYARRFAALRAREEHPLLFGLEIGMQPHIAAENDAVAASQPFDVVLGAMHCIGRRDLYEPSCYEGRTRQEIIAEFLEEAAECVAKHKNFDSFAHVDYMCRYWPYKGEEAQLYYEDEPDLFDMLLKTLIANDKPMEINTRRLDDEEARRALLGIYKRYRELGGRYCTLGSDAHYKEHIGRRLDIALAMAKEAGLTPVYFKKRKMQVMEPE